jgi:hypothetical protein
MKIFSYHWQGMTQVQQIEAYDLSEARRLIRQLHFMFRLPSNAIVQEV